MDILILASSFLAFVFFLVSTALLLRCVSERRTIGAIFALAVVGFFFAAGIWLSFTQTLQSEAQSLLVFTGLVYVLGIYCVNVLLFIFSIFIAAEGSLTLRLLHVIASHADGIKKSDLLLSYSLAGIVEKRLDRLVASGEVAKKDHAYELHTAVSYFRLREKLFAWYWSCFS